ncbi:MAG TPA: response regulator, partial [Kofleriaceae bacterium]
MLVEDDDAVRGFAKRGLTRLGYTVVEASNGEQAMELAARSEVQLLLTDVIMPGISGPELAAKIRGERPTLKVMFMSGYTRNALEPNMLEQGRSHFVEKPIAIATLGHALRDLLDSETRTTRGTQPAR